MQKLFIPLFFFVAVAGASAQEVNLPALDKLPAHPRILLLKDEEKVIRKTIAANPAWGNVNQAIIHASDAILATPPAERIVIGIRLLDVSRECFRRLFYLSYSFRITGDEKYFLRAEKEMLAVSNFSDWNPSHFLDVAEMTMGLAIGYDWLYDRLSRESRQVIREAILKKGLEPSFDEKYNWFLTVNHNWNQVCNAGMTYGALAIAEDHPEIAKRVIERAIKTVRLPMEDYKPDGAYAEGYGYWGYGTSFNIMFLSALERAFASDFGLPQIPGFLKTAAFRESMIGTTGVPFNWGDCWLATELNRAMFWFAQKTNELSLLWVEKSYLETMKYAKSGEERILPAAIIWGKDIPLDKIKEPTAKVWIGQGANPVALMRTSWSNPNAIYLGFKAGSASVNHAHMDIGSFVMESDGIRWASDFGAQDYESLETKGLKIFGRTQDAQRWSVFRLNNYVHNTLTIDNQLQLVKGYAKIDRYSDKPSFSYAVSDLSTVYENQLANISRGVGIVDQSYVIVQDELTTLDRPTTVRWTMLTTATVSLNGNLAVLTKDGKQLTLKVESPTNTMLKTWSAQPTTNYDAPNPGATLVGFEIQVAAKKKETVTVKLLPQGAEKNAKAKVKPLPKW